MRLVDYSSSDEEDSEETVSAPVPVPPLPSTFHDLYSGTFPNTALTGVKPRVGDDPSLHEGRIRGHPHIPGQWPTHAYIECIRFQILRLIIVRPSTDLHSLFHSVVSKACFRRPQMKPLLLTEFGNIAPLHVSLSRPLVLWTHEKEDFLGVFTKTIHELKCDCFHAWLI